MLKYWFILSGDQTEQTESSCVKILVHTFLGSNRANGVSVSKYWFILSNLANRVTLKNAQVGKRAFFCADSE